MKSSFPSSRRRWTSIVLRLVFPVVTFVAGWYCASPAAKSASTEQGKITSASNDHKSALPSAEERAQLKAKFAALLKIHGVEGKRKMYAFIASLDAESIQALLTDLAAESPRHTDGWFDLTLRWARLDPKAAMAWAQSLHDFSGNMNMIFEVWAQHNPTAALATFLSMPNHQYIDVGGALNSIIESMAKQNPQNALAALRSLPAQEQHNFDYDYAYSSAFATWANSDPTAAAAAALNLPPGSLRDYSLTGVAENWAGRDPTAALAWANSLPAGAAQSEAIERIIITMSEKDPQSAANLAAKLSLASQGPAGDPFANPGSDPLLGQIASNWAQNDPAGLLTWADKNLTGATFDNAATAALKQLGQTDPTAAAAALAQISDPAVVNQAIPNLAAVWAQQDMQGALTWAQALPTTNADVRQTALNNILSSWSGSDPTSAAAYLAQNLSTDPAFGKLAAQMAKSWTSTDPQAALTWAQSLPPGDSQNLAVVATATQLAKTDPETAWNVAEQLAGPSHDQALSNVITSWADQQPDQAAAALSDLAPGKELDNATSNVAESWLGQDPAAATDWIGTLPEGSARDEAVGQLVDNLRDKDPVGAYDWAVSISDPATRNKQVVDLASNLVFENPTAAVTAAQQALTLSGLTASQQKDLQKIVDKAAKP